MIEQLIKDFTACPQVEAVALGGSRAGEAYDEKSDYDVYVYCNGSIPEEKRHEILSDCCKVMEIGNHFWEYEDNCTLTNGVDIDIIYRNL
ncbi:MAG: nucleotidyltransferase domain-containing protein [Thermoflexaceae bacterium]|nr:nucleotidyltransferase domain-containing protein [Thermoflexaceae bacterium]